MANSGLHPRPDRGVQPNTWLVGPHRAAPSIGGGGQGTRHEVRRRHTPHQLTLPIEAARSATGSATAGLHHRHCTTTDAHAAAGDVTATPSLDTDAIDSSSSSAKPDGQLLLTIPSLLFSSSSIQIMFYVFYPKCKMTTR
jgi:hypothetical protein